LVADYLKRLTRFVPCDVSELKEPSGSGDDRRVVPREGEKILTAVGVMIMSSCSTNKAVNFRRPLWLSLSARDSRPASNAWRLSSAVSPG
jgi:hypothetical protein